MQLLINRSVVPRFGWDYEVYSVQQKRRLMVQCRDRLCCSGGDASDLLELKLFTAGAALVWSIIAKVGQRLAITLDN